MSFEVRPAKDLDEFSRSIFAIGQYFGMVPTEERMQRFADLLTFERTHAAFSDGAIVGGAGAFTFNVTVPGGDLPTAGVTVVGVYPTHRRRGVLRALMRAQLDDAHERGEPLAALWASEETIYGRFGYGLASWCGEIDLAHEYTSFAHPFEPGGTIRFLEPEEALEVVPPVFERTRLQWPGMFSRSRLWWEQRETKDPEERREGAGPKRWIVYERDGAVDAYAAYRHKPGWEAGSTIAELRVVEALGATPTAERELWRFVFGIDLIARVQGRHDPASPLFLMVVDPRSLQLRVSEGLWLRLVDIEAALAGRRYATDDSVVVDVRDEFCPWNAGRWRVGADVTRTDDAAELELDVADLASVYLGAFDFSALARAERVRELEDGALERADALFRTSRPPYCPEDF